MSEVEPHHSAAADCGKPSKQSTADEAAAASTAGTIEMSSIPTCDANESARSEASGAPAKSIEHPLAPTTEVRAAQLEGVVLQVAASLPGPGNNKSPTARKSPLQEYERIKFLGCGDTGRVYLVRRKVSTFRCRLEWSSR